MADAFQSVLEQALAEVHGQLIVQAVQARETARQLQEQNETLATVIALSPERGQS